MNSDKIFLLGLPGAGKTTLGKKLAHKLDKPFVDLDYEIERFHNKSIEAIFASQGESYFRELERKQLNKVIEELPTFILSTGGGTPCFHNNMDIMKNSGVTIFLNIPIEKIKKRLNGEGNRPVLKTHTLESLFEKRKKFYLKSMYTANSLEELLRICEKIKN